MRRPPRTYSRRKDSFASASAPKRRRTDEGSGRSSSAPAEDVDVDVDVEAESTPSSPPPPPPEKRTYLGFSLTTTTKRKKPAAGVGTVGGAAKKLTQMKIDLGQPRQTTCATCGMSYYPSTPDDSALHRRFHAKSVGGVDFKVPVDGRKSKVVWRGEGEEEFVVVVERRSSAAERRKAKEVLEVVEVELSAAEICEGELWGESGSLERFKVLLYVRGKKCVGLCLAERIARAYRVLPEGGRKDVVYRGSSVSVEDTPRPAILGISRVWVCADHRRQGIATRLLDCARENFIYGMEIVKDDVAFSQPTESGGALARGWFGEDKVHHWAVYVEEV